MLPARASDREGSSAPGAAAARERREGQPAAGRGLCSSVLRLHCGIESRPGHRLPGLLGASTGPSLRRHRGWAEACPPDTRVRALAEPRGTEQGQAKPFAGSRGEIRSQLKFRLLAKNLVAFCSLIQLTEQSTSLLKRKEHSALTTSF